MYYSDDIKNPHKKNITIIKENFSVQSGVSPDILICRHVIEHIPKPIEFLKSIQDSINDTNCTLFFEVPDMNWILKSKNYFDLPYEHCSYFNNNSIITAFNNVGFNVKKLSKNLKVNICGLWQITFPKRLHPWKAG